MIDPEIVNSHTFLTNNFFKISVSNNIIQYIPNDNIKYDLTIFNNNNTKFMDFNVFYNIEKGISVEYFVKSIAFYNELKWNIVFIDASSFLTKYFSLELFNLVFIIFFFNSLLFYNFIMFVIMSLTLDQNQ